MKKSHFSQDAAYKPYVFKGLHGRYLHLPAASSKANRTFILIYGQHATLERARPVGEGLTEFGDVFMVDNPGFGGMEPSYKIKEHPTLSFMASHLNYFVEAYIPADRQLTIVGISYGFQIVTTALAEYPSLAKRTEQAVSLLGFVKYTDLSLPLAYKVTLAQLARPARRKTGAAVMNAAIRPPLLKTVFFFNRPFNMKYKDFDKAQGKEYVDQQIWLWMVNDHRTHGSTAWDFLKTVDLTDLRPQTDVIHVGVPNDHLINNPRVVGELRTMFKHVESFDLHLAHHAPLDIDTREKVLSLLPEAFVKIMSKSRNTKSTAGVSS